MDDEVINLGQIFNILRKHLLMILTLTCIGGVIAAAATYFILEPKYESSSLILVNRKESSANAQLQQVQTDLQMINTYKDIITKPVILDQAQKNLEKANYVVGDLQDMITLTNNQNSQVVSVNAKASDPYLARAIVNEVVTVFKSKLTTIMNNAKNVSVISKGTLNKKPVSPRNMINIAIGFIVGAVLGTLLAFIRELTDKTVKDTTFITETLGMPLLGTITNMERNEMKMGQTSTAETKRGR